jgi:hypothetical protein
MESELSERAQLRRFLVSRFDLDELKDLAFDLGVDSQLFVHGNKRELSRELIAYCERRGMLSLLVTEALKHRPDNSLVQLLTKLPPASQPFKKVQIIVAEDLLEDVSEFLEELAAKLNVAQDEVVLISSTWGSMRLLVSLPQEKSNSLTGSQLRTLAGDKYHISITAFDSLDSLSQNTWRFVSRDRPPIRQGNQLRPTVSWQDARKMIAEAAHTRHTPSEQSLSLDTLRGVGAMTFTRELWQEQISAKLRYLGGRLVQRRQQDLPYLAYGTVAGLTLWPLVDAFARSARPDAGGVEAGLGPGPCSNERGWLIQGKSGGDWSSGCG